MNKWIKKIGRLKKTIQGKDFYWKTQVDCEKLRMGNQYADWTFCTQNIDEHSIVYSFGIGTDISFDTQLIQKYGLTVFAYDPTPLSIEWLKSQNIPKEFIVQQIGLANFDGEINFNMPEKGEHVSCSMINTDEFSNTQSIKAKVFTLKKLMTINGHVHIDILKIDIEGAEYDVLKNICENSINVKQILVEFHHRFKEIGIMKSIEAIKLLNSFGYKIFYISDSGEEYSFIKTQ